jgi:uncharacterized YceG family protein
MLGLLGKTIRIATFLLLALFLVGLVSATGFFVWTKHLVKNEVVENTVSPLESERFPVGVDMSAQIISEDPLVEWYAETYLSMDTDNSRQARFIDRVLAQVSKWDWYQQLASGVSRILVIYPGERKEQVTDNFGDILKWTEEERTLFESYITEGEPFLEDGSFYPGRYVVAYDATPEFVANLVFERFSHEILSRYDESVEAFVPLKDALTIASLLEREAYDFTDMRIISGVIWNRLFIGMPLQLDASLQYARGSDLTESDWWPKVVPDDKFTPSPYNTYENAGLPPAPIANPSVEAVLAALNPRVTDCMFYFHDAQGKFYCTETYEEHVEMLTQIYGQGR